MTSGSIWLSLGFASGVTADVLATQRSLAPLATTKPEFALEDLTGTHQSLGSRAGCVVLVHFFATWCEPCLAELASLTRLAETHNARDLAVLAISVGEVPIRVQRFFEATTVSFPVLLDTHRTVARAWQVGALPTSFVLDRRLKPRLFVEGDVDWSRRDVLDAIGRVEP